MIGFWFGFHFFMPMIVLFWLIRPDFLLKIQQLSRLKVIVYLAAAAFVDLLVLFMLFTLFYKDDFSNTDVIGLLLGLVVFFCVYGYLFFDYGRYLAKLNKTSQQESLATDGALLNNTNPSIHPPSTDNSKPPKLDNAYSSKPTQSSDLKDWQTYKEQMQAT